MDTTLSQGLIGAYRHPVITVSTETAIPSISAHFIDTKGETVDANVCQGGIFTVLTTHAGQIVTGRCSACSRVVNVQTESIKVV
jgi:hypothetical protein